MGRNKDKPIEYGLSGLADTYQRIRVITATQYSQGGFRVVGKTKDSMRYANPSACPSALLTCSKKLFGWVVDTWMHAREK